MTSTLLAALPLLLNVAQDVPAPTTPVPATQVPTTLAEAPDAQQAREEAFAKLLTGATLVGYTTLTGGDGKLTSEELQKDSYTLTKVSKQDDGKWRFQASMDYGGLKLPISVSLPVEWAGDTPVICVTDMKVAMMGTYSARVVFHGDQYVGVWSGDGYGGHILGQVVSEGSGRPSAQSTSWPSFRGKNASGVAHGFSTVESFDVEEGDNVLWGIEVPGLAHSAPVIWGDKLFLTTAIRADGEPDLTVGLYGNIEPVENEGEYAFEVHCYDKTSGERLWRREVWKGIPKIKRHTKGSHAASTPTCDAERVVAFFGSEGMYAFDHDGEPLWDLNFGVLDSGYFAVKDAQWGFASSPVLHGDHVILQCDVQDQSFLTLRDARTGEEVWTTDRKEAPGWSTPTVHVGAERSQVLCNGWKEIASYDLKDGKRLWTADPGGDIPVPTPVVAHGHVYLTNAHGRQPRIYAIDLDAKGHVGAGGDEPSEYLTWYKTKGANYMQTPIVVGDEAYFCRDNGVLTCFDAKTGDVHYSERLDEGRSGYTASAVAADGKVYFVAESGTIVTVRAGKEFEVLARSEVGEEVMATPAISEGVLYVRSRRHLYAIGD